ncbi:3-hydroxyacyl-CoA dehydrogenase [Sporosarcina sp. CAU 1771]
MTIKKVTVAGGGVLGSQIAFQTAFKGYEVALYDINSEAIENAKERISVLQQRYVADNYGTQEEVDAAYERLSLHTDLAKSAENADLVIEAIPEQIQIKKDFYQNLSKVAKKDAIFASNSSTFVPSQLKENVDRPERYLHLHFANEIWKLNVAEVMKHSGTADEVFEEVIEFAKSIAMVPIPIYKEQPGYVLNSLLVPLLGAGLQLAVNGVADPKTIDKTWMISTGAPMGPFAILDVVGPNTPYNLFKGYSEAGDKPSGKIAEWLKTEYLDKGRLGTSNGKGIYSYPNPEYANPDFLK